MIYRTTLVINKCLNKIAFSVTVNLTPQFRVFERHKSIFFIASIKVSLLPRLMFFTTVYCSQT